MADTNLYDILGISRDASHNEIGKAYKNLTEEYHPEVNPNAINLFKDITFAYEILSDPEKRAAYDNNGLAALQEQNGSEGNVINTFSPIFCSISQVGIPGTSFPWRGRRGEDRIHFLKVSLEDIYNGRTVVLQVERNVICPYCERKSTQTCTSCRGFAVEVADQKISPEQSQQINTYCHECNATGEIVFERNQCPVCDGKCIITEVKPYEINIEKGMRNEKLIIKDEGNEEHDVQSGNLVVMVEEKSHDIFERRGDDLFMNQTLSLTEALCGFTILFKHLDGRDLVVRSRKGEVIKPGDIKKVYNEGMPCYKNPLQKGHLFIKFHVEFPSNHYTDEANFKILKKLIPRCKAEDIYNVENIEEVNLHDMKPDEGVSVKKTKEYYVTNDDDDESDNDEYDDQQGL